MANIDKPEQSIFRTKADDVVREVELQNPFVLLRAKRLSNDRIRISIGTEDMAEQVVITQEAWDFMRGVTDQSDTEKDAS